VNEVLNASSNETLAIFKAIEIEDSTGMGLELSRDNKDSKSESLGPRAFRIKSCRIWVSIRFPNRERRLSRFFHEQQDSLCHDNLSINEKVSIKGQPE
jgi:hypothetical protein